MKKNGTPPLKQVGRPFFAWVVALFLEAPRLDRLYTYLPTGVPALRIIWGSGSFTGAQPPVRPRAPGLAMIYDMQQNGLKLCSWHENKTKMVL
jgi:hypothetical protein